MAPRFEEPAQQSLKKYGILSSHNIPTRRPPNIATGYHIVFWLKSDVV